MRLPHLAAVVAISAMVAIAVDAAYTIDRVVSSGMPRVEFSLGTAYRDVNYCGSQTLDIYVPAQTARQPLPLVVFVHGGGMTAGDKDNINPLLLSSLASADYAVASINYRLAPMSRFPAQIEDVKCSIRFLRHKAATYGLDRTKVFAFGASVGGQLVALAALTGPHSVFDVGAYLDQPSSVTAVVDFFGPANLGESSGFSSSGTLRVFGPDNGPGDLQRASPTHYVAPNAPPIMLVHGTQDAKVPVSQSIELYNDLAGAGDHSELVLVRNMGHMFVQVGPNPLDPGLDELGKDMADFFNRNGGDT
jgi:acetyl esterase/lipase